MSNLLVFPGSSSADNINNYYENLKSEQARLDTFSGSVIWSGIWSVPFIKPADCASAGFFFWRYGDKVQCTFCRGVAEDWELGDIPLVEHKRLFPRCPFICNLPVGNIPIGQEHEATARLPEDKDAVTTFGLDFCIPFERTIRPYTCLDQVRVRDTQPLTKEMKDVEELSLVIKSRNGPTMKNLVTFQSRLKTFINWPISSGQSIETMAEAGFYYIGTNDHVKCFYCDGSLWKWEVCDDPWLEHPRWFSVCPYLISSKGHDYIKTVNETNPQVVPSTSFKNSSVGNSSRITQSSRKVTVEELRRLIYTPIVQAVLELGMDVGKVRRTLQCKLEQTGTPFLTTKALIEAVLEQDLDYDTTDMDENDNEEEDLDPILPINSNSSRSTYVPVPVCTDPVLTTPTLTSSVSGSKISSDDSDNGNGTSSIESNPTNEQGQNTNIEDIKKVLVLKEKEIQKLRESRECKICMENEVEVVFLPCSHLISCVHCATTISNCPLCRQPVKAMVRTYLSY